jgi:hypothetical protein
MAIEQPQLPEFNTNENRPGAWGDRADLYFVVHNLPSVKQPLPDVG